MTQMKTISVAQATERLRAAGMRMSPETLREGLLQKAFPFGIAVKTETSVACWVFPNDLEEWIQTHLV